MTKSAIKEIEEISEDNVDINKIRHFVDLNRKRALSRYNARVDYELNNSDVEQVLVALVQFLKKIT